MAATPLVLPPLAALDEARCEIDEAMWSMRHGHWGGENFRELADLLRATAALLDGIRTTAELARPHTPGDAR